VHLHGHLLDFNAISTKDFSNVDVNPRLREDQWKPIEMEHMFKVVTSTYLATGGDRYSELLLVQETFVATHVASFVSSGFSCVAKRESLDPPYENA
jgi:hypothetical protein